MNWKLFIAKRVYRSNEGGKEVSKPAVRIAMLGIAIGLAVMIVSVAVVIGFKHEVRDKVIGLGSDIMITNFDARKSFETIPIVVNDSLLNVLYDTASTNKVLVSRSIADKLHLKMDDKLYTYYIEGENVRARRLSVAGIYQTNFSAYDDLFLITDLYTVNRLNSWQKGQVSGIELEVNEYSRLESVKEEIRARVDTQVDAYGGTYYTQSVE